MRHQFGDDWADPDAALLPSERRDRDTGWCTRAGSDALRSGLAGAVATWLPGWAGRLDVMPPVHCRSLAGSNMKAATSARGRRTSTSGRTSTAMLRPRPGRAGRPARRHDEAGKNGCGLPLATYAASRSMIWAQV